jgi:putrescine transport system permease protein
VIFSSVRMGVSPQINALATLFLVVVTLVVILAGRLMMGPRRRARPAAVAAPAEPAAQAS